MELKTKVCKFQRNNFRLLIDEHIPNVNIHHFCVVQQIYNLNAEGIFLKRIQRDPKHVLK